MSIAAFSAVIIKGAMLVPLTVIAPVAGFGLVAFGCIIYRQRHQLWFALTLTAIIAANTLGYFQWWHQIDHQRTLGALPLYKNVKELMIEVPRNGQPLAVLTITKEFETTAPNTFSPEDWEHYNIPHKRLDVYDLTCPTREQIREAVNWSSQQRAEGRHIYFHCKVGIGRSATILTCDLLSQMLQENPSQFHGKTTGDIVDDVVNKIKAQRSYVMLSSSQRQAVIDFLSDELRARTLRLA